MMDGCVCVAASTVAFVRGGSDAGGTDAAVLEACRVIAERFMGEPVVLKADVTDPTAVVKVLRNLLRGEVVKCPVTHLVVEGLGPTELVLRALLKRSVRVVILGPGADPLPGGRGAAAKICALLAEGARRAMGGSADAR